MYTFDENIARIEQAKSDIKAAIEEKGVYVGDGNINTYAGKVRMIKAAGKQQNKNVTITENNTTISIVPDDGYILDKVNVTTEIPIGSKSVEYNRNGNYTITPEESVEGYDNINVNVNVPIQDAKDITINRDGHYDVTPDSDNMGIAKVRIDVDIPIQSKKALEVSDNGIYTITADENYEGLETAEFKVDIPFEKDVKLTVAKNGNYTLVPSNGYKAIEDATIVVDVQGGDALIKLPSTLTFSGGTVTGDFDMGQWDWSDIKDWSNMFNYQTNLTSLINFPTDIQPVDMRWMFQNCRNLTSLDLSSLDTSKVTNMNNMFRFCENLTSLGDLSNWDTSKVTDMSDMFSTCMNLTSLDGIENWDTSKVTDMSDMFFDCASLTSLDLSSWDTSNVTNMSKMFSTCIRIKEIKMGGDVSKVSYVNYMFEYITTTGTFYYNSQYDYSKIIAVLPSTWTAVPME